MLFLIICTYNRNQHICNVLKSIAENDYSRTEVRIFCAFI